MSNSGAKRLSHSESPLVTNPELWFDTKESLDTFLSQQPGRPNDIRRDVKHSGTLSSLTGARYRPAADRGTGDKIRRGYREDPYRQS
jgi:hypothetical protein